MKILIIFDLICLPTIPKDQTVIFLLNHDNTMMVEEASRANDSYKDFDDIKGAGCLSLIIFEIL